MNLLLLLSALLSALTGAGAQVRAPQQVVAVAQAVEAAAKAQVEVGTVVRPAVALPTLREIRAIEGARWALSPVAPLYLSRRRE